MQRSSFSPLPVFSPRRGVLIVVVCVLAAIVYSVLLPSRYSSEVSLIGASSDVAGGRLGSLAAQFGIPGLGASRGAGTPETFVEYMQSVVFEQAILEHPLRLSSTTVRLDSLWGDIGGSAGAGFARAQRKLERSLRSEIGQKSGTIKITCTTDNAELSAGLCDAVASELIDVGIRLRRSSAVLDSEFFRNEAADAQRRVDSSEARQLEFARANRDDRISPTLAMESDRLAQRVSFARQLLLSESQLLEQSRIDALRNAPTLTVLARPLPARLRDGHGTVIRVLSALGLGVLLCFVWWAYQLPPRPLTTAADLPPMHEES